MHHIYKGKRTHQSQSGNQESNDDTTSGKCMTGLPCSCGNPTRGGIPSDPCYKPLVAGCCAGYFRLQACLLLASNAPSLCYNPSSLQHEAFEACCKTTVTVRLAALCFTSAYKLVPRQDSRLPRRTRNEWTLPRAARNLSGFLPACNIKPRKI